MEKEQEQEFKGFDFTTLGKDIIVDDIEKVTIYNDGSGLTGDFSEEDNYYNDNMIKLDKDLNKLLEEE